MMNSKEINLYIYLAKFKDSEHVKIGWSVDPETRCRGIGDVVEIYSIDVGSNKSKAILMESMFLNALTEYRVPKNLVTIVYDGRTEVFLGEAKDRFFEVCNMLNLQCREHRLGTKVNTKRERCDGFKKERKELCDAYLSGYRVAVINHLDFANIDYEKKLKYVEKVVKRAEKVFYSHSSSMNVDFNIQITHT